MPRYDQLPVLCPLKKGLRDLVPWVEVVHVLGRLSAEELECLGAGASDAADVILALLSSGQLTAFVAEPMREAAFKIEATAWKGDAGIDAVASASTGRLVLVDSTFPASSLEAQLAHKPLLMLKSGFNSVVSRRTLALAELHRAGNRIIREHNVEDLPPMRRADFTDGLRQKFPSISKRQAAKIWRQVAPAPWKKAGPKIRRRT